MSVRRRLCGRRVLFVDLHDVRAGCRLLFRRFNQTNSRSYIYIFKRGVVEFDVYFSFYY